MRDPFDLNDPGYTPGKLLDATAKLLNARSDFDLARRLELDPAAICRTRHRKKPIGAHTIIQILDRTGWTLAHLRELMGVPFDGPAALVVVGQQATSGSRKCVWKEAA